MRVGIDFRPPLFSSAGIARATAELSIALGRRPGIELVLYGDAWRKPDDPARIDDLVARTGAEFIRARIPAQLTALLGRFGSGVEARTGTLDLFHYTDLVYPPVSRTPYVMTLHDLVFEVDRSLHGAEFHATVPARVRRALSLTRALIVSSEETRRQVVDRDWVSADRVHVVPLGGDHILRMEDHREEVRARERLRAAGVSGPYMICTGTIEPRKNHARLLDAYQRMGSADDRPVLLIVGRKGWLCDEVMARIEAGIPGVVHLSDVGDGMLSALIRGSEFSVYPSLYEGFGLPVLESMTLGVAVLTTRCGAIPEVGGDAVRYADATDVDSIAAAMRALVANPTERSALAEAGLDRAREFTWSRTAELVESVYDSALNAD